MGSCNSANNKTRLTTTQGDEPRTARGNTSEIKKHK